MKIKKFINWTDAIPKGYRVVYAQVSHDRLVVYLFGIHWIIMLARFFWLKTFWFPKDDKVHDAFKAGFKKGVEEKQIGLYQLGFLDGQNTAIKEIRALKTDIQNFKQDIKKEIH